MKDLRHKLAMVAFLGDGSHSLIVTAICVMVDFLKPITRSKEGATVS